MDLDLDLSAEPEMESLPRGGRRGIGSVTKMIFDVLYEAGEPLDRRTIAARSLEKAGPANTGHAYRAAARHRVSVRRSRGGSLKGLQKANAARDWPAYVGIQLGDLLTQGRVLRENDLYRPNPDKPPRLMVDAERWRLLGVEEGPDKLVPYTRDAWAVLTRHDEEVTRQQIMRMEMRQALGGLSRVEREAAVGIVSRGLSGIDGLTDLSALGIDASDLHRRLKPLIARASTDDAKAFLLHALVDRAYHLLEPAGVTESA